MDLIYFTETSFKALKLAYNKAESLDEPSFTFEGQTFVTAYAKYLIEYLSSKFPSKP